MTLFVELIPRGSVRAARVVSRVWADALLPALNIIRDLESCERAAERAKVLAVRLDQAKRSKRHLRTLRLVMPQVMHTLNIRLFGEWAHLPSSDPRRYEPYTSECKSWDIACYGVRYSVDGEEHVLYMSKPEHRRRVCLCETGVPILCEICVAHEDDAELVAVLYHR